MSNKIVIATVPLKPACRGTIRRRLKVEVNGDNAELCVETYRITDVWLSNSGTVIPTESIPDLILALQKILKVSTLA